jgi:hypothetical protein
LKKEHLSLNWSGLYFILLMKIMLETDKILKELDMVKDITSLEIFFDTYLGKK